MVFQGTVLGPILWNIFYSDVRYPMRKMRFTETIFADDLNASKEFDNHVPNDELLAAGDIVQAKLHT